MKIFELSLGLSTCANLTPFLCVSSPGLYTLATRLKEYSKVLCIRDAISIHQTHIELTRKVLMGTYPTDLIRLSLVDRVLIVEKKMVCNGCGILVIGSKVSVLLALVSLIHVSFL